MSIITEAILCYGVDLPNDFDWEDWKNKIGSGFEFVIHGGDGYSKIILAMKESIQSVEPGQILSPNFEDKHFWHILCGNLIHDFPNWPELRLDWKWYLVCSRF